MEFRITVRLAGQSSEDDAERLLDAFLEAHPEVGPVVETDLADQVVAVTYSLDAEDLRTLVERAAKVFAAGYARSGLPPGDLTAEVGLVDAAAELERELQPA
jgi:hypothetical protein